MDNAVWRITDVAYYCSLRERTILKLVAQGRIPYRKLGRTLLFLRAEVEAWLRMLSGVSLEAAVEASHTQIRKAPVPLKRSPARQRLLPKVAET
jgi:excisionase family DNA binding protein